VTTIALFAGWDVGLAMVVVVGGHYWAECYGFNFLWKNHNTIFFKNSQLATACLADLEILTKHCPGTSLTFRQLMHFFFESHDDKISLLSSVCA
jgi:hypothetical protein